MLHEMLASVETRATCNWGGGDIVTGQKEKSMQGTSI